VTNVMLENHF